MKSIQVLYFARVKEKLNYSTEALDLPDEISNVAQLKQFLAQRGDVWADIFASQQLIRAAINHQLVDDAATIQPQDEVAFFPPVTGG